MMSEQKTKVSQGFKKGETFRPKVLEGRFHGREGFTGGVCIDPPETLKPSFPWGAG
jgi:hypothetical protein